MFSVLLWKEWRQLRALRWTGWGLAALLPVFLLAVPSAARQGWIPLVDTGTHHSAKVILMEALPLALAYGLWPLVALLMSAQAFAGDRSAGTESFLLRHPVPRGMVWNARFLASLASTLAVVAGSLAAWVVLVVADGAQWGEWIEAAAVLARVGPVSTVGCLLAGAMAASVLDAPLAALLLGVVLGLLPVQIGVSLASWSTLARLGALPVAFVVPVLLVLAYPLGSRLALCRGEPAGRGRTVRGLATLLVSLGVALVVFVLGSATVLRASALGLPYGALILPTHAGGACYAQALDWEHDSGWLVSLQTGRRVRFFPPPVKFAAWSQDGERLAVVTDSGPLGSITASWRLEFVDREGQPAGRTLKLGEDGWLWDAFWVKDRIVGLLFEWDSPGRVIVYSPDTGEQVLSDYRLPEANWHLLPPTPDGKVFLAAGEQRGTPEEELFERDDEAVEFGLYPVDPETAAVAAEPVLRGRGSTRRAADALSPSGRFWIRDLGIWEAEPGAILDLRTGEEARLEGLTRSARWMAGDVLVWDDRRENEIRLLRARPGETPVTMRSWAAENRSVTTLASPDRVRLLVRVHDHLETSPASEGEPIVLRRRIAQTWVYEAGTGQWTEMPAWPARPFEWNDMRTAWADPHNLVHTGPGLIALERVDRPGELTPVLGKTSR